MTEDLETLKSALDRATPPASDKSRADALSRAMQTFDALHQGSETIARPTKDQPERPVGLLKGLATMFAHISTRQALLGSASLAAIVIAVSVSQNIDTFRPNQAPPALEEPEAIDAAPPAESDARQAPALAQKAVDPKRRADTSRSERQRGLAELRDQASSAPAAEATSGLTADANAPAASPAPAPAMVAESDRESFAPAPPTRVESGRERFPQAEANPLKTTAEAPVSTFSIDVDTASYS